MHNNHLKKIKLQVNLLKKIIWVNNVEECLIKINSKKESIKAKLNTNNYNQKQLQIKN